jgi:hypothetical protein
VTAIPRLAASTLAVSIALCLGAPPSSAQWAGPAGSDFAVTPEMGLVERVKSALEEAPYLYDRHIDVSMRDGRVVLSGFVFSDWDLRDALRIATSAARPYRVIDSMHIEEGGRR